jgi:hypothetical protein
MTGCSAKTQGGAMKRCLLHLQIRDQLLDPVNCELVADSQKQFLVMLYLLVEWGTFFAHREYMRRVVKLFLPNVSSFAIIRLGLELGNEAFAAPKLDRAAID